MPGPVPAMVEMVPSEGNFPHAVVARVGDVDGAVGGNRDGTGSVQLSGGRRTSIAAESRGAGARDAWSRYHWHRSSERYGRAIP